jgi:hypothetical protein
VTGGASSRQHAERLLRCYPRAWRERYGEEFVELLIEDFADRPHWSGRTFNVVTSGLLARMAGAGLSGPALDAPDQARASLAALIASLATFLALGISMWSQLTIGWQWSAPDTPGTTIAVIAMSVVVVIFAVLAACAAGPVIWTLAGAFLHKNARGLARPLLLAAVGLAVVIVGSRHFGNGWPGTGGHPWSHQGMVPGGVAAFSWAATLSITSYWMHPSALFAFPPAEVAWMFCSPVAMGMAVVGSAKVVRRVQLAPRVLRMEIVLGRVAAMAMSLFLVAAGLWTLKGGPGPRGLFDTGEIDRFALAVMTLALGVAVHSLRRARGTRRTQLAH